ncbi:myozenin-3 [Bufo gargarizans]|uniref:myozenin-3 n=1 Tax=Bufo gargarizans TaxID=30331 RepID=UPI001CF51F6F|nr:myozenin-3 [Bufo gargarizans]XP_044137077.1 myozenin-3 [Bufo gargarizans]
MFPKYADLVKERKGLASAIVREIRGEAPLLDLGKKVSVPQDVMMEELSLHRNRGSCMYLERQKRVQKFTFEYPTNRIIAGGHMNAFNANQTVANDVSGTEGVDGKENFHTEIHIVPGSNRTPPNVPTKSTKVLQMKMSLNPGSIAPGYSGPLKEIPYEKFNSTAIPKSYRSPWAQSYRVENVVPATESLPPPPHTPVNVTCRTFNRTPIPFGSLSVVDGGEAPNIFEELQAQIEESTSGLDLMCRRPSFNRAPRGWANKYVPESPDL